MKKLKNITRLSLLIGVVIMVFTTCSKKEEEDSPSNNPFNGKTTAVFNPIVTYGTMTDQDGNVYKTVTIGRQTWMAENLRTTKYNDGTAIPNITDTEQWAALNTGAYCNYENTTEVNRIATYGRLYNWFAVNTGKLAPKGWHVPTDEEWTTLTTYLGGSRIAGGKLKEAGNSHWTGSNTDATNETGYTALPGGERNTGGVFGWSPAHGSWWSVTEYDDTEGYYCGMTFFSGELGWGYTWKVAGISVRCLKD